MEYAEYDEMEFEEIGDIEEIEEIEEDAEVTAPEFMEAVGQGRRVRIKKHRSAVNRFLGKGKKVNAAVIKSTYYGELLTWALHRYIESENWKVAKTTNYQRPEPKYIEVSTGIGEKLNLLRDGTLFLVKGDIHLAVTVDLDFHAVHSLVVTGLAAREEEVKKFAAGVEIVAKEQNLYRGKKLDFFGRIRFLDVAGRTWDSIALDKTIKDEIKANTIGFLAYARQLAEYGIPARRGVILVGEPGTGKTLICKALMAESEGITCILANSNLVENGAYIDELYELAKDLAPSMVFIEDIDLIGRKRMPSGYSRGAALLSLLNVLDGVEEQKEIVTVATTNYLETLDQAIIQRPSRFDRIIELSRPALEERRKLVALLCRKILLEENTQEFIARRTENQTPAQIQEVIYSLVIGHVQSNGKEKAKLLKFSREQVDEAVCRIGRSNGHGLGFVPLVKANGVRVKGLPA